MRDHAFRRTRVQVRRLVDAVARTAHVLVGETSQIVGRLVDHRGQAGQHRDRRFALLEDVTHVGVGARAVG